MSYTRFLIVILLHYFRDVPFSCIYFPLFSFLRLEVSTTATSSALHFLCLQFRRTKRICLLKFAILKNFPAIDIFETPFFQNSRGSTTSDNPRNLRPWLSFLHPILRIHKYYRGEASFLERGFRLSHQSLGRKILNNNALNQVADQQLSLKQWFAAGVQSCRLRKSGSGHCYLRISHSERHAPDLQ